MAKKVIRRMKLGVLVSLLVLIFSSLASYYSLKKQLDNRDNLSQSRQSISAAKDILLILVDAETGNRGYQLTGDAAFLDSYYNGVRSLPGALAHLKELRANNPWQGPRIKSLEGAVNERLDILKNFITIKKEGKKVTNQDLLYSQKSMELVRLIVADFVNYEEEQLEIHGVELKKSTSITGIILLGFVLLALIIIVYLYFKLKSDIISKDVLQKALEEKDELISNKIHAIQLVANQVAKGDFSQRAIAEEKDDLGELATSFNNMTDSLKKSFDQINKSDWYQKGLAQINESLVGNKNVNTLTKLALQRLVEYGNSVCGALYIAEGNKLVLSSAYGLEQHVQSEFQIGEGILGQSFALKRTRIYNNIEERDKVVSFATSTLKINAIIIVPIMLGKKAIGIVELASGNSYLEENRQFYEECCRTIGIAINAAMVREERQKLLDSTQQQTEELKVKHEELENLNAELEAQTQRLQASEEELRVQQEELFQSNSELAERTKLLEDMNLKIAERNKEIRLKAKELAISTKYKSEFLANMSHELRTPLNSILLLSRLLAENSEKTLTSEQVESVNVILSSGKSLLTLIDEILDLAKIESGKMTVEPEEVVLEEVLQGLKDMFQPLTKDKGLALKLDKAPDVTTIVTDRLRLEQVLRNLISNAIKFTSEGGVSIKIENDKENINHIKIRIEDSGIGISEGQQKNIFEAFQQADGSTRRKYGGTGLGLSISREISKLLGGDLSVDSKLGKGSVFTLRLPIYLENKPVTSHEVAQTSYTATENQTHWFLSGEDEVGRNERYDIDDDREALSVHDKSILIVEDDIGFAEALLKYTRNQGYKGIVVTRGEHVLEIAKRYFPVAILLDIQLPVKDGWHILKELKDDPTTNNIPVHMMSSLNVRSESLKKGADHFIDKPIALEEMALLFQNIEEKRLAEKSKILIVEENPKHAQALRWYLESNGVKSSVTTEEAEVISSLKQSDFDCVIFNIPNDETKMVAQLNRIKEELKNASLTIILLIDKPLSVSEELMYKKFADSIVVKTAHSYQRILDEVGLFLQLLEQKPDVLNTSQNLESLKDVLKGKKVLVTDDDVRNIFSITKVLESYKMKVLVAMDGKQALSIMSENLDIDVVLMDMMMPEMDGYEAIKEMRRKKQFKTLPIIAVTAKSMHGEREKCIEAGASDYITKPVDTDQLLSLLRVWLY